MSRAKKLLQKTKKIKDKVNRNFTKIQQLHEITDVFDIITKKKEDSLRLEEKRQQKEVEIVTKVSEFSCNSVSINRLDFDFPNGDNGLELVVPPGIITASEIGSGDEVEFLEGELAGLAIEVIEVLNLTRLRLDDIGTFNQMENNIRIRFILK